MALLAVVLASAAPARAQGSPPFAIDTATDALTGLWWNPDESGWGMSLTQQRNIVFVTWYTYDEAGAPVWYVMSSCRVQGNACEGEIYRVRGGRGLAAPWSGAGLEISVAGSGRLEFTGTDAGVFRFTLGERAGGRSIRRQVFGSGSTRYSGLWWNASESGWGVALAQQGNVVFVTAYTYDAAADPTWLVASRCALTGPACTGELYRVTGGTAPWLPWRGASLTSSRLGALTLEFSDADNATLSIDGVPGTREITRQRFVNTAPSIQLPPSAAACPADVTAPLLGTSPVALEDFIAFRPLGFMSTPIHMFPAKHSAFSMTPIGRAPAAKPVVAPGRAVVTEIYEASFSTGGRNYQVFMHPCREVRLYFGHLATVSTKLLDAFNAQPPACNSFADGSSTVTTCRRVGLNVQLEEGEAFATGPDSAGVDFGALDFRLPPAAFVRLDHYDTYYPYYASPLGYFSAEARAAIAAKTGEVFGTRWRTALPVGGRYMLDLPGTARGNWFLPGRYHSNSTDLSPFVGLAYDYVDPSFPLMAIGTSVPGMNMGLYSYRVESAGLTNRDFSAIHADGSIHCIDSFVAGRSPGALPLTSPGGALLLALPTAETLALELRAGASCGSLVSREFSGRAVTFQR